MSTITTIDGQGQRRRTKNSGPRRTRRAGLRRPAGRPGPTTTSTKTARIMIQQHRPIPLVAVGPAAGAAVVSGRRSPSTGARPGMTGPSASGRFGAELGREPVVEFVEALDDHLGLAEHRHEVGVAVPPGDDVPVQVAGQPRAGRLAQVQPDVVALRAASSGRGSPRPA